MAKRKKLVVIAEDLTAADCRHRMAEIAREAERMLVDLEPVLAAMQQHREKMAILDSEKYQLENRLEALKGKPAVSDHALVRYLERKYDFDSDAIRKEILSPEVESAMRAGADGCKSHGGRFKFREMTVVTYVHPKKG